MRASPDYLTGTVAVWQVFDGSVSVTSLQPQAALSTRPFAFGTTTIVRVGG